MTLLALDIASRTGWAAGPVPGTAMARPGELGSGPVAKPASGWFDLPKRKDDLGAPLSAFVRTIEALIETRAVSRIVFEAPILPRPTVEGGQVRVSTNLMTARRLYAMAGLVEWIGYRQKIGYVEAHQQKWRKAFLGRGAGFSKAGLDPKRACVAACRAMGWEVADHNEADALGVWFYHANAIAGRRAAR